MTVFEGKLVSENIKVGIVASRFNEFITSKLIGGAMDGLLRHNVREQDVDIAWVPGASAAPRATTTWSATRPPRASPTYRWKAGCPLCSAS